MDLCCIQERLDGGDAEEKHRDRRVDKKKLETLEQSWKYFMLRQHLPLELSLFLFSLLSYPFGMYERNQNNAKHDNIEEIQYQQTQRLDSSRPMQSSLPN